MTNEEAELEAARMLQQISSKSIPLLDWNKRVARLAQFVLGIRSQTPPQAVTEEYCKHAKGPPIKCDQPNVHCRYPACLSLPPHEHLTWDNCPHEHTGCLDCGATGVAEKPAPTATGT
jgi:hypothetical protein